MIILNNWSVTSNQTKFRAPDLVRSYLQGEVYGHPEFADGIFVKTSAIRNVANGESGDSYKIVETATGSQYAIHPVNVDPEYEKEFPGAYESLCISN